MRYVAALLVVVGLLWMPAVNAQSAVDYDAFAFETITVSSAAIGFTAATIRPSGQVAARYAFCTLAADNIRYRYDGSDPTATVGHYLIPSTTAPMAEFTLFGYNNISKFRAILDTGAGGDATLSCTYSR